MNIDTFDKLLASYGTVEANWPVDVRDAAREFLSVSAEARALVDRYAPLDTALDKYTVAPNTAKVREILLSRTSRSNIIDRITAWLLPESANLHAIWRPALVASLPLILGIILGSTLSLGSTDNTTDTWSNEISLVALSNNDTESVP